MNTKWGGEKSTPWLSGGAFHGSNENRTNRNFPVHLVGKLEPLVGVLSNLLTESYMIKVFGSMVQFSTL